MNCLVGEGRGGGRGQGTVYTSAPGGKSPRGEKIGCKMDIVNKEKFEFLPSTDFELLNQGLKVSN